MPGSWNACDVTFSVFEATAQQAEDLGLEEGKRYLYSDQEVWGEKWLGLFFKQSQPDHTLMRLVGRLYAIVRQRCPFDGCPQLPASLSSSSESSNVFPICNVPLYPYAPQFTITRQQPGFSYPGNPNETPDVYLDSFNPGTNQDGNGLSISWTGGKRPYTHRTLIRFDISVIPAGRQIVSATLKLNVTGGTAIGSGLLYDAYRCTGTWKETEATWNMFITGVGWFNPGGDFDSSVSDDAIAPASTGIWEWDVAALAQDIVDNHSGDMNLLLKRRQELGLSGDLTIDDGENATLENRPKLEIVYRERYKYRTALRSEWWPYDRDLFPTISPYPYSSVVAWNEGVYATGNKDGFSWVFRCAAGGQRDIIAGPGIPQEGFAFASGLRLGIHDFGTGPELLILGGLDSAFSPGSVWGFKVNRYNGETVSPVGNFLAEYIFAALTDAVGHLWVCGTNFSELPNYDPPFYALTKWDGAWHRIGRTSAYVQLFTLAEFLGDIYVGGLFDGTIGLGLIDQPTPFPFEVSDAKYLAQWNPAGGDPANGEWIGIGDLDDIVTKLLVYDDGNGEALWVCGKFTGGLYKWDGLSLSYPGGNPFLYGPGSDGAFVWDMCVVKTDRNTTELMVVGSFDRIGSVRGYRGQAFWDGSTWHKYGRGLSIISDPTDLDYDGSVSPVNALPFSMIGCHASNCNAFVFGANITGGNGNTSDESNLFDVDRIGSLRQIDNRRDGGPIGIAPDSPTLDVAVLGSDLYAAHNSRFLQDGTGTVSGLSVYDGESWSSAMSTGIERDNDNPPHITRLLVDAQNRIWMCGLWDTIDGLNSRNVAIYDPSSGLWSSLAGGLGNGHITNWVIDLAEFPVGSDFHYYAGGSFEGGASTMRTLAYWDGAAWNQVYPYPTRELFPAIIQALFVTDLGDGNVLLVHGVWDGDINGNSWESNVAAWDGSEWHVFRNPTTAHRIGNHVNQFFEWQGHVYLASESIGTPDILYKVVRHGEFDYSIVPIRDHDGRSLWLTPSRAYVDGDTVWLAGQLGDNNATFSRRRRNASGIIIWDGCHIRPGLLMGGYESVSSVAKYQDQIVIALGDSGRIGADSRENKVVGAPAEHDLLSFHGEFKRLP